MKLHAFIFERALIILLEIGSDGDRFVRIGIPFERTQVVWHLFVFVWWKQNRYLYSFE